ncbi:hypothetical protein [Xenorhabdus lircayensis]|uniref:Uncharacterized protein n=1 Tax=Xenorhabdus lircayensis TaxID=2763499 RepID=A0ABS0U0E0_9GAMM|nr:hypothetical protein [Xenorhabdus lircayensis]MBI6547337.1 hypothetical protein [Xenorhabdus lircayensis]
MDGGVSLPKIHHDSFHLGMMPVQRTDIAERYAFIHCGGNSVDADCDYFCEQIYYDSHVKYPASVATFITL